MDCNKRESPLLQVLIAISTVNFLMNTIIILNLLEKILRM